MPVFLSFCSSNSSSTTSLASNSPKTGASDWAVPQASRLKYRQQFNTLDKLMSGYLSGGSHQHTHTRIHTSTHSNKLNKHEVLRTFWLLMSGLPESLTEQVGFIFYTHTHSRTLGIALNPTWQNAVVRRTQTRPHQLAWEVTLVLFLMCFTLQDLRLEMRS